MDMILSSVALRTLRASSRPRSLCRKSRLHSGGLRIPCRCSASWHIGILGLHRWNFGRSGSSSFVAAVLGIKNSTPAFQLFLVTCSADFGSFACQEWSPLTRPYSIWRLRGLGVCRRGLKRKPQGLRSTSPYLSLPIRASWPAFFAIETSKQGTARSLYLEPYNTAYTGLYPTHLTLNLTC